MTIERESSEERKVSGKDSSGEEETIEVDRQVGREEVVGSSGGEN